MHISISVPALPSPVVPWRSYMGAAILGGGIGYTLAHLFKVCVFLQFCVSSCE